MKSLRKPFVIIALGLSNCLVLGSAFYSLMSGQNLLLQASSTTKQPLSEDKVQEQIEKECEDHFKRVLNSEDPTSYICTVKTDIRDSRRDTSYTYRARIQVSKNSDGISIKLKDGVINARGYAADTEAGLGFCYDCEPEEEETVTVNNNDIAGLMSSIVDLSNTVLDDTNGKLKSAREDYIEASKEKRANQKKADRCEGKFDEDDEDEFIDFDDWEEQAECHQEKMSKMDLQGRDSYYHSIVSPSLWTAARGDEYDHLLPDILGEFSDPYKYSFSVRASTGLINQYLGWKDDFSLLDSQAERDAFTRRISSTVDQMARLMTQNQATSDLRQLNTGLKGSLARVYQPAAVAVRNIHQGSSQRGGPDPSLW